MTELNDAHAKWLSEPHGPGDRQGKFYNQLCSLLLKSAAAILRYQDRSGQLSEDERDDLAQDVVMNVIRHLQSITPQTLTAYLSRAVRNATNDHHTRHDPVREGLKTGETSDAIDLLPAPAEAPEAIQAQPCLELFKMYLEEYAAASESRQWRVQALLHILFEEPAQKTEEHIASLTERWGVTRDAAFTRRKRALRELPAIYREFAGSNPECGRLIHAAYEQMYDDSTAA